MLVSISSQCFTWGLNAYCKIQLSALTRCFVLWVPFFEDVFGPEKNAALSLGIGFDDHQLCTCHCQGMLLTSTTSLHRAFFSSFYSSEKVQTRCEVLFRSLWL